MRDGLLAIDLVREIPEAMKPRKIDIGSGEPTPLKAEGDEAERSEAPAEEDQTA